MKIKFTNTKIVKLGESFTNDQNFIRDLYASEPSPVFEFSSYHILSYLSFNSELYGIETDFGKSIVVVKNGSQIFLFTPKINNIYNFKSWVKLAGCIKGILNISENWLTKYSKYLKGDLVIRSSNEAIYDVQLLNNLHGKEFTKLRNCRNKLLNNNQLLFQKVSSTNFKDAISVLEKWQLSQGGRYQKNKFEKEKYLFLKFLELSKQTGELVFEIGYINKIPLSVCAFHKVEWKKDWGTIYLVKGINRASDGGIHGVSDATYCHVFNIANKWHLKLLNDGELGSEEGTKSHKLGFKPVYFLKSFDILL